MRGFAYVKDVGQVSYGIWDHPELRPVFEEILGHATGNATSDDPAVRARMKWEYLMLLTPFLREFPEFAGPGGVLRTTVDHRHFFFNGRVAHETVTLKKAFADFALDHVEVPSTPHSELEAYNEARRAAYEKTRDAGLVDIETDLARMEMAAACKRVAVRAWQRAELDAREEKRVAAAAELVRAAAEELPTCHGTFLRLSKSLETLSVQGGSTPCRAVVVWRPQSWGALPVACVLEVCDFLCVKALGRLGVCGRKCLGGAFRDLLPA